MSRVVTIQPPRIYPTFRYRDAAAMTDWLVRVFGFSMHASHVEDGRLVHAELALGSSMIMLGQVADDAYGALVGTPGENGGKSIYIAVEDVEIVHRQAVQAGADIIEGPVERGYGGREFICRDPEGNIWCVGTYWPKAYEAAGG